MLEQQFPRADFALFAIILLAPLIGAFVNGVFGKRLGKDAVRTMALSVMGVAFATSLITFGRILSASRAAEGEHVRLYWEGWQWFEVTTAAGREITIDIAFSADALSGTMLLVVTGVGFLIHLYSTEYMAHDPGFYRFFAYLNLFIFSMLLLILGDNLVVLFVGWEGVGLCSYLLIGFWFTDEKKAAAGKKAFITNRIGDFGLLVAMAMMLYAGLTTFSFSGLESQVGVLTKSAEVWPPSNTFLNNLPFGLGDLLRPEGGSIKVLWATLIGIFLFIGCMGKSAQIPLYVWLPDAMAGPTPVSALIHAATMVTAGVYLVARLSFLFVLSPAAMAVVATTGALTALFAASIAFAQTDLKKVLAYSTVSQLGFMFIGVGVGAFAAGFFHVITHAFFKGCLFLCAGSVIHAMHERIHSEEGSQDMRNMGGLKKHMPITHATFLVSCLAIAGAPLFSGFWSKDELLYKAFTSQIKLPSGLSAETTWMPGPAFGKYIYVIGALAALGTAFYMFRAYFLTFHGKFRGWKIVENWKAPAGSHHHDHEEDEPLDGPVPHESPWPMTVPLVILATFAAFGGFLYAEPIHVAPLEHFWQPVFAQASASVTNLDPDHAMMYPLLGVGSAIFFVGAGAAYWVYQLQDGKPAAAFVEKVPGLHRLVLNKWKIDELYDATVVGMVDAMADTAAQFDRWVIDGILAKLTSALAQLGGTLLRSLQTGKVQVYAAGVVIGTAAVGIFLFEPHPEVEVDESQLSRGVVVFEAAPGHGYQYRWSEDGKPNSESGFNGGSSFPMKLRECERKSVTLEVKNALGRTASESFTHCRSRIGRDGKDCCRLENPTPLDEIPDLPQGTVGQVDPTQLQGGAR